MGQMTFGIMYGVQAEPPEEFEDGWYDLTDKYKAEAPVSPSGDGPRDFLGYWVAVGGSGEDGIPHLADRRFALQKFTETKPYDRAFLKAVRQWGKFVVWAKKKGYTFPEPQLYLLETETA